MVQREAEVAIVDAIGRRFGVALTKRRVVLAGEASVEIDGVDADLTLCVEAFARQGPMRGGQKRKVALDVLKLITVRLEHKSARLVLAFCDGDAATSIRGWEADHPDMGSRDRRRVDPR